MPRKLKKGALAQVCSSDHRSLMESYDGRGTPMGYIPLTLQQRQEFEARRGQHTLSEILQHTGGTHLKVQPEPGTLVTVIKPSVRVGGPFRANFVVVADTQIGATYFIEREFIQAVREDK